MAGDVTGTVLVTGGTGTTGRRLAALLRGHGVPVRVASRRPGRGTGYAVFDWTDPATYPAAVAGAESVYLVRPPATVTAPLPLLRQFLATALDAGVRRVVLLHSTVTGPAGVPEAAAAVEQTVPEWAILCPSWFMQNFTGDHPTARGIREHGEIATATGTGRVGFIDADDIAACACAALLAPEPPDTRYVLTGPEALSHADIAAILTEVTGRPVRHVDLTARQLTDRWVAAGLPEPLARTAAELDRAIANGEHDYTTTTVADLTGRPPRTFREHAARSLRKP